MARVNLQEDYTILNDREIAASGIGSSPVALAAFRSIQRAVYEDQPADTAEAQAAAAEAAEAAAAAAEAAAQGASAASDAQGRADDAFELAETKVTKDVGPVFAAPLATPARTALPAYAGGAASAAYDAAEIAALKAQVAGLTGALAAVIVDLRANGALTDA